jgi:TM2 domain-containing membrane protein YozV
MSNAAIEKETTETEKSGISGNTVFYLSVFLGMLGIDRFYAGKKGTGTLKLLTIGGFFIWWLADLFLIASGKFKDAQGKVIETQLSKFVQICFISPIFLFVVLGYFFYLTETPEEAAERKAKQYAALNESKDKREANERARKANLLTEYVRNNDAQKLTELLQKEKIDLNSFPYNRALPRAAFKGLQNIVGILVGNGAKGDTGIEQEEQEFLFEFSLDDFKNRFNEIVKIMGNRSSSKLAKIKDVSISQGLLTAKLDGRLQSLVDVSILGHIRDGRISMLSIRCMGTGNDVGQIAEFQIYAHAFIMSIDASLGDEGANSISGKMYEDISNNKPSKNGSVVIVNSDELSKNGYKYEYSMTLQESTLKYAITAER